MPDPTEVAEMPASPGRSTTAVRVVLLSLDAFPHRKLSPDLTPRLWALAHEGGWAPGGGRTALPSVTYPSHAMLLTGCLPTRSGIRSNLSAVGRDGAIPGWAGERQVAAPTLLDACAAAGVPTAAVLGDHKLSMILRAGVADLCWPSNGAWDAATELDPFGYATNAATMPALAAALVNPRYRLVLGHLNETDTAGHLHGPDAPEAEACYRETDALVGAIADGLRPAWDETVLVVTSDHGMALIPDTPPIDLIADPRAREVVADLIVEGDCALAHPPDGVPLDEMAAVLSGIPGIDSCEPGGPGYLLVVAAAGHYFGNPPPKHVVAGHGGRFTQETIAIVAGGHPAVPTIATGLASGTPANADWAPTIAAVLGLALPDVDGRDLATIVAPSPEAS